MDTFLLAIVVVGSSFDEAMWQCQEANRLGGAVEFCLDRWDFQDFESIRALRAAAEVPVIFTIRRTEQLSQLPELADLRPDYFDIDSELPSVDLLALKTRAPGVRIISSKHHYDETPQDLEAFAASALRPGADIVKIATTAHSSTDALRMLRFVRSEAGRERPIVGLCMGDSGQVTRILGPVFGSLMGYASVAGKTASAPGQLTAEELQSIYHFDKLNPATQLFGLIGDPVDHSPGHRTHNAVLRDLGVDGVYVKMLVRREETEEFLALASELVFRGFSVTMPLKESVLPFVTQFHLGAEEIGAVNTLRFGEGKLAARNTDSCGALDAIEAILPVRGRTVVIVGAGGVAKGIAHEACARGAQVWILNRTLERARVLAEQIGARWGGLGDFESVKAEGYDVIVNALALGLDEHPLAADLLPDRVAMDVNYSIADTPFLTAARAKGCRLVYGLEMYFQQAVQQFVFWLGESADPERTYRVIERAYHTTAQRQPESVHQCASDSLAL